MIWLLLFLLLAWSVFATIYLWRFARILLVLESGFSDAVEKLQEAEHTMQVCLELPMFFDSPDVQKAAIEALETIKVAKLEIAGLVRSFTQYSKQKYIEVKEVER